MRLASRLGGTWVQLAQTSAAAAAPRTRPAGTASGDAVPASDHVSHRDQPTILEVPPAPRELAAAAP
jgi:hypothetical protein